MNSLHPIVQDLKPPSGSNVVSQQKSPISKENTSKPYLFDHISRFPRRTAVAFLTD